MIPAAIETTHNNAHFKRKDKTMAYSNATIKKVYGDLQNLISYYGNKPADDIKVSISAGNKKIGRVLNVSLAPIHTCANCSGCMHYCYDIKACLQYKNVRDARARNTVLALKYRDKFFSAIISKLSKRRINKFMRWHVSGDIPDYDYLDRMVQIARMFPDFVFWTYTKNYFVVNQYVKDHGGDRFAAIPANLSIMFSEWDSMPLINPYNFPIFTVKLKAGNVNHDSNFFDGLFKCPGNCDVCKFVKRGCIVGENTYTDEH